MKTIYFVMYYQEGMLYTAQTSNKDIYQKYTSAPLDSRIDLTVMGRNSRILLFPGTPSDYRTKQRHQANPRILEGVYLVDRGIMDIPNDAGKKS